MLCNFGDSPCDKMAAKRVGVHVCTRGPVLLLRRVSADSARSGHKVARKKLTVSGGRGPRFIDWVRVRVAGGKGGDGCRSFRREAHMPFGGPDGGSGGAGGSVVVIADRMRRTLAPLRKHYTAGAGGSGRGANCQGRHGEDVLIKVPIGTVVVDTETGGIIADLNQAGAKATVAQGGQGGLGNAEFATAEHQRPQEHTPGEEGEGHLLEMEMKTIADVGLVGFPNAGKSTLLRAISQARPAVAAYPFTTLKPHVGVVEYDCGTQIAVADIPGLVAGAHKNIGLGHAFLRHIERCRILLFVVDLAQPHPLQQVDRLQFELNAHLPGLGERTAAIVANKMDVGGVAEAVRELAGATHRPVVPVSGLLKWNTLHLKQLILSLHTHDEPTHKSTQHSTAITK